MIKVEGLTKFYGSVPGIQDVSFHVDNGEILGFLGPNGAGKSTTMRILTGYMPPTSGMVTVSDYDVTKNPLEVQKLLGYLPENNPLYPEMTVTSYLDYVASLKAVPRGKRKEAIDRVVESCGLERVSRRIIGHLSKGYRQRVGLAQALVNDPPVLILDEPTSGLDPAQIIEIRNLIRGLKGSRTIILSTHILPEVNLVCDRVVIIHQGRLAAEGELDTLAKNVQGENVVRVSAIGSSETLRNRLASVGGVQKVSIVDDGPEGEVHFNVRADNDKEVRPALAAAVSDAGAKLTELHQMRVTLEDLFVRIIGGERRDENGGGRE